jgi:hypothetical protein
VLAALEKNVFGMDGILRAISGKISDSHLSLRAKNRWTTFIVAVADGDSGPERFSQRMNDFLMMPTSLKAYWQLGEEASPSPDAITFTDVQALFEVIFNFSCNALAIGEDNRDMASKLVNQWKKVRPYLCCFDRWLSVSGSRDVGVLVGALLPAADRTMLRRRAPCCGVAHHDAVSRTVMRSAAWFPWFLLNLFLLDLSWYGVVVRSPHSCPASGADGWR